MSVRALFILKCRETGPAGSWCYPYSDTPLPSGLSISAEQVCLALDELEINNKVVQVIDNNDIDREVAEYKPTHVFIEAFWVVPEKFAVLRQLHPMVKWIIRNHSKADFLSHEGGVADWALEYVKLGLTLACNSPESTADFKQQASQALVDPALVVYLPNCYSTELQNNALPIGRVFWKFMRAMGIYGEKPEFDQNTLHIGCFGAIRPLKNNLNQAKAAIQAADSLKLNLQFLINGTRVEGQAETVLEDMRALFKPLANHSLVEIPWLNHVDFLNLARSMDLVMQVSDSETFNIVAADAVSSGTPVLVSTQIPWLSDEYAAEPTDVDHISAKILEVLRGSGNGYLQQDQLKQLSAYSAQSKVLWNNFLQT